MKGKNRVIIENVQPEINHGEFPVKRVIHDTIKAEADIFCDGHDAIRAEILYKHASEKTWNSEELTHLVNDRWDGQFTTDIQGEYTYTIRAWADKTKTWHRDILKKIEADVDIKSDIAVGLQIIEDILKAYTKINIEDKQLLNDVIALFKSDKSITEKTIPIVRKGLYETLLKYPLRINVTTYQKELKAICERKRAVFSSWYEFFPRSLGAKENRHGTLLDCIEHLKYVADMGFDVIYLPPIHPIGNKNRKGKNNALKAGPGDVGSPWAIGSDDGGHKAIHKDLGTLEQFKLLVQEAGKYNIEIAMDIALQCSPDHPYIKEHPEWFKHRPDGTIQYAENPPKKYEDIYPFDFENDDWESMWQEFKSIFDFWISQGVKIFRVDNPHTKSLPFWGWLIREIQKQHPDTIFLAEAFTRPKVMYQLAKQGFTQSYTYFTWRNTRQSIAKYFEEIMQTETSEFFRPNLWPNTPDILPEFLQISGKPGYSLRAVLAASLSSSYGIYGPAFELMDSIPKIPGGEEYIDSEKYEIKNWDLNKKGSLKSLLKILNQIRNSNPALQNNRNLQFHETENENLIAYSKHTDDFSNIILVVANLDPYHTHSGWVHFPFQHFEMGKNDTCQVHDQIGGSYFLWNSSANYVELNPGIFPAHIFKVRRKVRTEQDFDYFM